MRPAALASSTVFSSHSYWKLTLCCPLAVTSPEYLDSMKNSWGTCSIITSPFSITPAPENITFLPPRRLAIRVSASLPRFLASLRECFSDSGFGTERTGCIESGIGLEITEVSDFRVVVAAGFTLKLDASEGGFVDFVLFTRRL